MSFFPGKRYKSCSEYVDDYFGEVSRAQASVDRSAVLSAVVAIEGVVRAGGTMFACGNGGSAAIANHLLCDYLKGMRSRTSIKPRVVTLSSAVELITAVANDIGVEEIFAYPLQSLGKKGDILIAISSSGRSPNIVRAVEVAIQAEMTVIALTGFSGGQSAEMANISIHVDSNNYGVVEDVHQSVMHLMAQYLRQASLVDDAALGEIPF